MSRQDRLGDLIVFLIPFAQFVRFSGGGELFGSDFVIVCALPFLLLSGGRQLLAKQPSAVLLLGSLWLFGQISTDLIRGTAFEDWTRGWLKVLTFFFAFAVIHLLSKNKPYRFLIFAAGLGLGGLLTYFVNPGQWAQELPWKFGYGLPLAQLAIVLSCFVYRGKGLGPAMAILFLIATGIFYIFVGSRALGMIMALTGAFVGYQQFILIRQSVGHKTGWRTFIFMSALGLVAGIGALELYGIAASEGILGVYQQEKYLTQSRGNLGLFLSGRNEILASANAILDSPIIGHGSWAKDRHYQVELYQTLRQAGQVPNFDPSDPRAIMLIPSHSHLAGAWVEGGILGGLFWIFIFALAIRGLYALSHSHDHLTPLIAFCALTLAWDILFSPLGGARRFITPFYICCILYALNHAALGLQSVRRSRQNRAQRPA